MKRTSCRIRLCAVLLLLNLVFIWGNSLLPGELSDQLSRWAKDFLSRLLPGADAAAQDGTHFLRKAAHFTEFACLGACFCWLAGMLNQHGFSAISLPLSGAMAVACVDETIQRFVAGRSSSLLDVWIDTAGAAAGIVILLLGYHCIQKSKIMNGE